MKGWALLALVGLAVSIEGILIFLIHANAQESYIPSYVSSINQNTFRPSFEMNGWLPVMWKISNDEKTPGSGVFVAQNVLVDQIKDNTTISVSEKGMKAGQLYSDNEFKFGTYEVKMKFSKTENVRYAFFLYDSNTQNEIDIIEIDVVPPDKPHCSSVSTCIEASSTIYNGSSERLWTSGDQDLEQFLGEDPTLRTHTYKLIWLPGSISFFIDNKLFEKAETGNKIQMVEDFAPMHILVSSYAYGTSSEFNQLPNADSTLEIDSVSYVPTNTQKQMVQLNSMQQKQNNFIPSPLQQFRSGVAAKDVKCSDGFTLVIKAEDGSPACTSSQTAQILIERGWGHFPLNPR